MDMENTTYGANDETIQDATNSFFKDMKKLFDKIDAEAKEALKTDLITALEKMGNNEHIIKEIESKGLPAYFFVSSDIFPVCKKLLSKYGEVREHKWIESTNILCAWDIDF